MEQASNWKKVVYKETDNQVRCIQGYFFDDGTFISVKGDYKTVIINKLNVISIQTINRQAGDLNEL